MLCLLTILIFIFSQQNLYAQNTFIDSKVNFFQEQSVPKASETIKKITSATSNTKNCPTCSSSAVDSLNESLKTNAINEPVIKLFIDPACKYSQEAVRILKETLKENTSLKGQVYLIAPYSSLITFSQKNYDLVSEEIPIVLDTEEVYKNKFEIKATPSFIVETRGNVYRISGEPDNLSELIEGIL